VDLVAKEKGISRAQRLCTAKKIILAPGRRGAGEPTPRTGASPHRREQTWRESVQHRRNEEQLSTEEEQRISKPGKLQESTKQEHADLSRCKEDPEAEPREYVITGAHPP